MFRQLARATTQLTDMLQISILQVEREKARAAAARIRDERVSVYQTQMLARQEFIAVRTKRDNTVMKVIAVLTALFLPGTFIAVSNLPHFSTFTY
jgi:hypothetical protein